MRKDDTRLIILEGISGSGKSTLLRRLNEMRDFQDHHWHRWTATKWVYGTLNRRDVDLEQLRRDEEAIQLIYPTTLVTLVCSPVLALERKSKMQEEYIEDNIAEAQRLFSFYHNHLTVIKNKISIWTGGQTVDECAEFILENILVPDKQPVEG